MIVNSGKRVGSCDWCGGRYTYKRSSKKFCSTACRVQWHKHGELFLHLARRITSDLNRLWHLADLKSRPLINPKFLEATGSIVVQAVDVDQHLLKSTSKGVSQQILIDFAQ